MGFSCRFWGKVKKPDFFVGPFFLRRRRSTGGGSLGKQFLGESPVSFFLFFVFGILLPEGHFFLFRFFPNRQKKQFFFFFVFFCFSGFFLNGLVIKGKKKTLFWLSVTGQVNNLGSGGLRGRKKRKARFCFWFAFFLQFVPVLKGLSAGNLSGSPGRGGEIIGGIGFFSRILS